MATDLSQANEFDYRDVDFSKPILDGPTHHGFHEFFGVPAIPRTHSTQSLESTSETTAGHLLIAPE